MKFNQIVNNFASGELSRLLKGRTDLEEFYKGSEELTNFIPLKQGGATFRPGTVGHSLGTYSYPYIMFPFSPEDGRNYMIFVAPGYDLKIIDLQGGTSTINKPLQIFNKYIDFSSATGVFDPATADSTLLNNMFKSLMFASNGDVFIIIDGTGTIAPIAGKRTATNTFLIDSLLYPTVINPDTNALWLDISAKYPLRIPFKDTNIENEIQMKPSALTGNITITCQNSSAVAVPYFSEDPVGQYIKINQGTSTGIAIITSKVSTSVVNARVIVSFVATTATSNWEVSAWNATDGYPRSAAFFEGRLYFGGNKSFPDTLWGSAVGNIYHFMQRRFVQDASSDTTKLNYFGSIKETDPFNFTIASTTINSIQWIYPSDTLIVGSTVTEYSISGGTDSILSISSINVKAISSHGSAKVQPVKVGSSILFVSFDGKRLLEIPKRLQDYVSATELTSISEGIMDKLLDLVETTNNYYTGFKITQLCYQENEGIVWALIRNETYQTSGILSLTIDRTSKSLGWAKHTFPMGTSYAKIRSIAVSANPDRGNYSFLYLMVDRSASTGEMSFEQLWFRGRYSKMDSITSFTSTTGEKNFNHLDMARIVSAPGVGNNITLPSTFKSNAKVGVLTTAGEYLGEFTAVGLTLTIPNASTYPGFVVGYKYDGEIVPMPLEAGAQFGTSQGTLRRTHEISVFLDRSRGGKYKAKKSSDTFDLLSSTEATAAALYTGEKKLPLNSNPDDYSLSIKQDQPYPLTVLWLLRKGYTNDQ